MTDKSFNAKFRAALAEMPNPTKDNTANVPTKSGRSYSYNYEDLASLITLIKPVLDKHGLGFSQESASEDGKYVLKTHVFDDAEDHIKDVRPLSFGADAQAAGSYETYMRRYALKTVFGLAGEDDDGAATKPLKAFETQKPTTATQTQRSSQIQDDSGSGDKVSTIQHISALKDEALSLGIPEGSMKSWITMKLAGKQFKDASLLELKEIEAHIEQQIAFQKESQSVDQPSIN